MPEDIGISCYNCIHHHLCKFEPDWIAFPTKDEASSTMWFHTAPKLIGSICNYFEKRVMPEDNNGN